MLVLTREFGIVKNILCTSGLSADFEVKTQSWRQLVSCERESKTGAYSGLTVRSNPDPKFCVEFPNVYSPIYNFSGFNPTWISRRPWQRVQRRPPWCPPRRSWGQPRGPPFYRPLPPKQTFNILLIHKSLGEKRPPQITWSVCPSIKRDSLCEDVKHTL